MALLAFCEKIRTPCWTLSAQEGSSFQSPAEVKAQRIEQSKVGQFEFLWPQPVVWDAWLSRGASATTTAQLTEFLKFCQIADSRMAPWDRELDVGHDFSIL